MEFGPCKHGKFSETEYQETFVYDIVSHCDALRHPIMVDDHVLAPWEPEGERYAPAVVISGLEKRMADGKTLIHVIGFAVLVISCSVVVDCMSRIRTALLPPANVAVLMRSVASVCLSCRALTFASLDLEGVQLLSDDFLYSAEKTLTNWTINSNF